MNLPDKIQIPHKPGVMVNQSVALFFVLMAVLFSAPGLAYETITFYHNDALGSPIATSDYGDVDGNVRICWTEDYLPYGKTIDNADTVVPNDSEVQNQLVVGVLEILADTDEALSMTERKLEGQALELFRRTVSGWNNNT